MNFLAHAYLSFDQKEILVGNMISDFVKGKTQYQFIAGIQNGIKLHRSIDAYTDAHPLIKEAKELFRKDYRLYSGPIVDILLDHYLANNPDYFNPLSLQLFTKSVYKILEEYTAHLPLRFVSVLSYMKVEDWLFNYQYQHGIERSIRGMVRRSSFLYDSSKAVELFHTHYDDLKSLSALFIKDVKMHAKEQLSLAN